ncbi:MAG: AAA family ATPase [Nitriliruptor sp.]
MSRLDLVVGPNGAGKSTFVERFIIPHRPGVPFVNADLIAARLWPAAQAEHGYDAAARAAATRDALIERADEFIAETVFSHASKLDLLDRAGRAGYRVHLWVVMVPVELSVLRVRARVAAGGHDVPELKVRERHARSWGHVVEAVPTVAVARFWDNSSRRGPRRIAAYYDGVADGPVRWPSWVDPRLPERLGGSIVR